MIYIPVKIFAYMHDFCVNANTECRKHFQYIWVETTCITVNMPSLECLRIQVFSVSAYVLIMNVSLKFRL